MPFRKLENRKKAEICNCMEKSNIGDDNLSMQRPLKQDADQCILEDKKAQVLLFFCFQRAENPYGGRRAILTVNTILLSPP